MVRPSELIAGFTGTQRGMTIEQGRVVIELLKDGARALHHGDCIGSDEQAHKIARALGFGRGCDKHIILWPPINSAKRAWCEDASDIRPCMEYLERDWQIARVCQALIACPKSLEEELRSGTWATIRYARKFKRHIYIILPDGRVKEEL